MAVKLKLRNISALMEVVSVLPVTSCEAERAFSKMKLIKTELRSTMTDERFVIFIILLRKSSVHIKGYLYV